MLPPAAQNTGAAREHNVELPGKPFGFAGQLFPCRVIASTSVTNGQTGCLQRCKSGQLKQGLAHACNLHSTCPLLLASDFVGRQTAPAACT